MQSRHIFTMVLALIFTAIGSLIIIVFSPLRPMLEPKLDYLGRIGIISMLLVLMLLARRSPRFSKYWQILLGLVIMATAVSLDYILAVYLLEHLSISGSSVIGFTLLKLNEAVIVISTIILLTRLAGGSLGSIYIQKGDLKEGLKTGIIAFCITVACAIPLAGLFKYNNLSLERILAWLPWLLLAALANASQEELLFRGVFLRKLEPFFGKHGANMLIVLTFTFLHLGITYNSDQRLFLFMLIPLALAWGYIMQKTDSALGSILFHAGADILVFLGIFSNFA